MPFFTDNIRAGASGAGDFEVQRSLRFNTPDSAYLERTPSSASSRTTWTLSFWVKRSLLGVTQGLFCVNGSDNNTLTEFMFASGNNLIWSASSKEYWRTTRVFRDTNAWYHIVIVCDTTNSTQADRQPVYINGVRETSFSTQNLTGSGTQFGFNRTVAHQIGRRGGGSDKFGGYMAEINFIDGQALTPSSFAETDSITGEYVPIDTSGLTFGTNGYRLKFADNSGTSATTLGKDTSGNSNNYTPNNFSVSSGSGNDSVTDTPTNNWCTFNSLLSSSYTDLTDGNLKSFGNTSSDNGNDRSSFAMKSGKWYAEFKITGTSATYPQIGVVHVRDADRPNNAAPQAGYSSGMIFGSLSGAYFTNGQKQINNSASSFGNSFTTNDIIGVAFDADNGAVYFSKNGTFQNSGNPASGGSKTGALLTWTPSVRNSNHYMSNANYNSSGTASKFWSTRIYLYNTNRLSSFKFTKFTSLYS